VRESEPNFTWSGLRTPAWLRRIILQEAADEVVVVVAAVHGKIDVEAGAAAERDAVMRALVGSEGSTGAVNGAMRAMLAKLRGEWNFVRSSEV
jgi:hypothetical protein